MRILFTSDWHDDAVTLGVSRRAELKAYYDRVADEAGRRDVDVVVFCGDAFDPGSMLHALYETDVSCAFHRFAYAVTSGKVIAIAGNHDVVEVDEPLSTISPIGIGNEHVQVFDAPGTMTLADNDGVVLFLLLPYVSRAWADGEQKGKLDDLIGPTESTDNAFAEALRARKDGTRVVVVGHMSVPGAVISSESVEMARGRDLDLPIARIRELEPAVVVNGHYHRPQVVDYDGVQVVIPGSPLSFTTSDDAQGKGFVVVDV